MVYPLCIFGVERCKTLPAGNRPRLQGPILREAALRGLESKREAAHNLASKGYHTLCEHSLVLGDFCFLDVGRFDGFCVLSFRIGDVQNLSSQLRCHFRDSGCLVPDFLSNPHPFFRSALRLTWPLTEASTLSHWRRGILRLSLTAAVRCLFPSDFQRISTKTIIPAMPRKSSRIVYKTQQSAPKLRSNFCEIVRRIASRGAPFLRLALLPDRKICGSARRNHLPLRLQLQRPTLTSQRSFAHIRRRRHLNPLKSRVTAYKERSLRRF